MPGPVMNAVLAFLPFLAFAVLSVVFNAVVGLAAGAAVSAGLVVRTLRRGGPANVLETGTFVLLLGLTIYVLITRQQLSIIAVRLVVDLGLFAIILFSIVSRHPFTLQYAKERVAEKYWSDERFIHKNYVIAIAWACVFLVMVLAEGAMLADPVLPKSFGTAAIVAALAGGVLFTRNLSRTSGS